VTRVEAFIGLELHVQLTTRSKLFCACATRFDAPPNSNVCPVCLGHPGVLPVVNRRAVELATLLAHAVGGTLHERSRFARKSYFYPDLPKGYQITQYDEPLSTGGSVVIDADGKRRDVRIRRIHLEEDAGRLLHGARGNVSISRVDYNRAGIPLAEIVTEPDLRSPDEAHAALAALKQLVEYLGVCAGNMEEGNLRCDANVSVGMEGSKSLGTKTELKNLNSFRNVARGLTFEIARQAGILGRGEHVRHETRLWDAAASRTRPMRGKEGLQDYRYFPEPDLPPLVMDAEGSSRIRASMPELPAARRARLISQYGIRHEDAERLTATSGLADYFERAARVAGDATLAANWVHGELLHVLHETGATPTEAPVSPEALGGLLSRVSEHEISRTMAKSVFAEMVRLGEPADAVLRRSGERMLSDPDAIRPIAERAIEESPAAVSEYLAGKAPAFEFIFGQVMRLAGGRLDPDVGRRVTRELLDRRGRD